MWWDIFCEMLRGVGANLLTIPVLYTLAWLFMVWGTIRKRKKWLEFLGADQDEYPKITIYLSRHETQLPTSEGTPTTETTQEFSVVSSAEMFEALKLIKEIEQPTIYDWLPKEIQASLLWWTPSYKKPQIELSVCPPNNQLNRIRGNFILIGGPRSNNLSRYFLYDQKWKHGLLRPRLSQEDKEIIEFTDGTQLTKARETHNLGIIQRYVSRDKELKIIYLAGTGINGTRATVTHFRKERAQLTKRDLIENPVILEIRRRKEPDDITQIRDNEVKYSELSFDALDTRK